MYVDDPILATLGTPEQNHTSVDLVVLWWSVLGLPLALSKGTFTSSAHSWIGAVFSIRESPTGPVGVISVPQKFADELFELLSPFAADRGHVPAAGLDTLLGKAGRLAYLIPTSRPFVSALWGAYGGAKQAAAAGAKEAPPGRYAVSRFRRAARWIRTLLRPSTKAALVPLEQIVSARIPEITAEGAMIQFDASPWGGGAVLFRQRVPVEFFELRWTADLATRLGAPIGDPAGQTSWEYLALLVSLLTWGSECAAEGVAILGDNTGALANSLSFKGKGAQAQISRELAWRKVRHGWRFAVGHLPSEGNVLADCLSRTGAPDGSERREFPAALLSAARRAPPELDEWFVVN